MAINFPNSPSEGDFYTYSGKTWKWNGTAWERSAATETGNTEGNTGEVAYYDAKGSIIKGATAFYYDSTNLKVGIGTSGPDQTLGVSGDFYVSGGATFGGNIVVPDDAFIGVASDQERIIFDSNGNDITLQSATILIPNKLQHLNDSNTYLDFTSDNIKLQAGGTFGSIHMAAGLSADMGATFDGDVNILGNAIIATGGNLQYPDGLTHDAFSFQIETVDISNILGIGPYTTLNFREGTGIDINNAGTPSHTANILIAVKDTVPVLTAASQAWTGAFNYSNGVWGAARFSPGGLVQAALASADSGSATYMGVTAGQIKFKVSGDVLQLESDIIHAFHGISADAGATFAGAVNLVDNVLSRPELKDYAETVNAIGTITGNTAVSFADGNVQTVTGNGDCEFTFTNPPASGKSGTVTLIITNGGANTTTWNSAVYWPGNNAPSLTSSGVDIVSFMTIDAGTKIYGFVGGINFENS